jgi:periplasmic protein TonB
MYTTQSVNTASRGPGMAIVIGLHIVLVWCVLNARNIESALPIPPPLVIKMFDTEIIPPPEPVVVADPTELMLPSLPMPLPQPPAEFVPADPPVGYTPLATVPDAPMVADPGVNTRIPERMRPEPPTPKVRGVGRLPANLAKPPYPRASTMLDEEGTTTMKACVTPRGAVTEVTIASSSGSDRLDEAAVKWMKNLRGIKAPTEDGKPVAGCLLVPLEWKIERN